MLEILKVDLIVFHFSYLLLFLFQFLFSVRGLALPSLFSSTFFGWSVFHDPFPYLHLFAYSLFHTLNPFKLHTNTPNYPDELLNSLLCTSCSSETLCGLPKSSSIICTSTYLLSHTLKVLAKHASSLLFQFLYFKKFLIT